jgi:DNA-binding NarL/FixJ family response regulator
MPSEEAVSTLLNIQKMISNLLAKLCQGQPHCLIPDVSVQSMASAIEVAGDEVGDNSSDDSSACSSFDDDESEREVTILQPRCSQQRSSQRRRWTEKEEKLLRALKGTQKRNGGKPSDYQIASRLDRTESGIKQHWGIMSQKKHR